MGHLASKMGVAEASEQELRGLAFVDRSHRGRGLALRLVASISSEENEIFARGRRLLENNHAFVRFCILNDVVACGQGRRRETNRGDRS